MAKRICLYMFHESSEITDNVRKIEVLTTDTREPEEFFQVRKMVRVAERQIPRSNNNVSTHSGSILCYDSYPMKYIYYF